MYGTWARMPWTVAVLPYIEQSAHLHSVRLALAFRRPIRLFGSVHRRRTTVNRIMRCNLETGQ